MKTALEEVARLDGREDARELLDALAGHVAGIARQFDGLVSERGERLSNDPDILRAELAALGYSDDEALRRVGDWRSGMASPVNHCRKCVVIGEIHAHCPKCSALDEFSVVDTNWGVDSKCTACGYKHYFSIGD